MDDSPLRLSYEKDPCSLKQLCRHFGMIFFAVSEGVRWHLGSLANRAYYDVNTREQARFQLGCRAT